MEMVASALPRFLVLPENRSALAAIQDVLFALTADDANMLPNPLFVHGPSGSGKTYLVSTLAKEMATHGFHVSVMSANDFANQTDLTASSEADVLIVEDLQHLPTRYVETLIYLLDARLRVCGPTICTALHGPSSLTHRGARMPHRLTNRLAGGLVVAVEPMQAASRSRLLAVLAQRARVNVEVEILQWLAENLTGGGRQLDGAIRQLKTLQRLQKRPLRLDDVREHFRAQVEAKAPTVRRITEQVSGYYQVAAKHLLSPRRSRDVLLPRQVSMYLSRQLTGLSLQQIGKYFGGRDHKTVQNACRRVEDAMKADAALSGAVRQLHAELS